MSISYHRTVTFLSASVLLLSACVPSTPAPPPTPLVALDSASVAWAEGTGTATVEGQAFMKTRGGDVKYGAGNTVLLIPNTPHSFDWYARITAGRQTPPELDPRLARLVRKTTAGGDGRFKFENVPPGPYLILTSVTWEAPTSYGLSMQGGYLGTAVVAENGKTQSVIITQ